MDAFANMIASEALGELTDGLRRQATPFLEKQRAKKSDKDLEEGFHQWFLQHHQNERYYNGLDGYLVHTKTFSGLISSLREENDYQPISREEFVRSICKLFLPKRRIKNWHRIR